MTDIKKGMFEMTEKISKESAIKFLYEAAKYFKKRRTNGEDLAYWANIYNSENCIKIAKMIEGGKAEQQFDDAAVERVSRALCVKAGDNPNIRCKEYGQTSYDYWAWELWRNEAKRLLTPPPEDNPK